MKPCEDCGRMNPPEAVFCMTCGNRLQSTNGPRSERLGTDELNERLERIRPVIEDFAFDLARAGAKLYFGVKDPVTVNEAVERAKRAGTSRSWLERFKDVLAEARVEHLRRGGSAERSEQREWR